MQIDNCGNYSEELKILLKSILKNKGEAGEKITDEYIDEVDKELFKAYGNILSISSDAKVIASSIKDLQNLINVGNLEISMISNLATNVTTKVVKQVESQLGNNQNESQEIYVIGNTILHENETDKAIIDSLCTEKMESFYSKTFEQAKKGDENAILELDLTKKATNYILNKNKLNEKGKNLGALALLTQLLELNTSTAKTMAVQIASNFDLGDIYLEGDINVEKVRERIEKLKPGYEVDSLIKRGKDKALERKERIINTSSSSYRQDVEKNAERKRVIGFLKSYIKAVDSKDQALAEYLVNSDIELAKKALALGNGIYTNFMQKKGKENSSFEGGIRSLNKAVQKTQETVHIKEQNTEER